MSIAPAADVNQHLQLSQLWKRACRAPAAGQGGCIAMGRRVWGCCDPIAAGEAEQQDVAPSTALLTSEVLVVIQPQVLQAGKCPRSAPLVRQSPGKCLPRHVQLDERAASGGCFIARYEQPVHAQLRRSQMTGPTTVQPLTLCSQALGPACPALLPGWLGKPTRSHSLRSPSSCKSGQHGVVG